MDDLTLELREALAGRYTIEREIGRGGMASVFLAQDVKHTRPVAVKVLHPELTLAVGPPRFLREIQVAARLRHPHIVPLFDSGDVNGLLFYVMPYIPGESLRTQLHRVGRFEPDEALRIAREIADALDYAHGEGIVHRDIKPDNVMIEGRHALITDFGIARALSRDRPGESRTSHGQLLGTPGYMSPEQLTGEHPIDGRSDIYSLGCVLFEMLAGQPPFDAPTQQAVLARRFATPVPALPPLGENVPPPVGDIVNHAMRVIPTERFQSAREMCNALDAVRMLTRRSDEYVTPPRLTAPASPRRVRMLWLGGIGALAAIAAVAIVTNRTTTDTRPRGTAAAAAPNAVVPSIGVLPFANRSDNKAMEYFSDGVTDELITALSRVNGLEVAGRTSSFSLKGKGLDVTESASRLKVAYVVDGSVRKNGSTVRVTWQLIDGKTGRGIGSGDVDGEMRNVIALQDSLARSIVAKLGPVLGSAATPATPRHTTANFEAYDLYLKGHYFWNQRTPAAMRSGIAYLKEAIGKDPNYALAYADLASAYTLQPGFGDARPAEVMGPARAAAQRAFALDSTLSESYTALGISSMFNDWQWAKALEYLDRAIALDPKNSFPRLFRAWPLVMLGRMDEAIAELRKARDLDPLSAIINTRVGSVYSYAGRFDEAIVELRKVVAADPSNLLARFSLARALLYKGQYTDAIKEAPDAIDVAAGYEIGTVALAYGLSGRKDEARALQQRLQARSRERYITAEAMVMAALAVDDKPRALSWLERGLREHSFYMPFIGVERLYDPIRDDPRFKEVLRKIGL